jgi:hypothetical protein
MARIPKISIQGWTEDGPAYTIHRTLAGWRHRKHRRQGNALNANELVGPHPDLPDAELPEDVGASFMVFAVGEVEVQAFRRGHVYEATLLVDGDAVNVLVDARGDHEVQEYATGITLLSWRVLEGEELESAIEHGPALASNVSDGAESQEPQGDHLHETLVADADNADDPIVTLTGAQVEEISETAALLDAALTPGTPEHEQVVANIGEIATEIAAGGMVPSEAVAYQVEDSTAAPDPIAEPAPDLEISDEAVGNMAAIVEALADESLTDETPTEETPTEETPAPELTVEDVMVQRQRWEELEAKFAADQITDEELDELQSFQDAARAVAEGSIGDDEDAVGGADDLASDEEE